MNKRRLDTSIDVLVIDDVYTENQIQDMLLELNIFLKMGVFLDPEDSGSATYEDGTPKKKNKAVFIDEIYHNRSASPLLVYPEIMVLNREVKNMVSEVHPSFNNIWSVNQHNTMVSYYESSDMYDFHYDHAAYTTLSYIFKEPKKFEGGEIMFDVGGEILELEIKNNMSIIFPSGYNHSVNQIRMNEEDLGMGLGRFCITQFLGISLNQ